jgi:hypothetical protein
VPGSSRFEAHHFVPIYRALQQAGVDFIIIGGQACNLWALMYEKQEPALKTLRPYTTRDLDIWSGSQKAVSATAEILHVKPKLNEPDSSAPDMGHFIYRSPKGKLFVQFLTGVYGVKTALVIRSRQNYTWTKYRLDLSVMHPLLTLEAKLDSLYGLDQSGRQDLKHLKMSLLYVPEFILEKAREGEIKATLRMCQHLLKLAGGQIGLKLHREKGIAINQTIPAAKLAEVRDPKIERFLNIQLPRAIDVLAKTRR